MKIGGVAAIEGLTMHEGAMVILVVIVAIVVSVSVYRLHRSQIRRELEGRGGSRRVAADRSVGVGFSARADWHAL